VIAANRLDRLPTIETKRLRLSALDVGDAEALHRLTDDPTITGAIDFLPTPFTRVDAVSLIRSQASGHDRFSGIKRIVDGALVGVIGTHVGEDAIEVGYWIGAGHQGMGYATEALRGLIAQLVEVFPDQEIVAECRPENLGSWTVLSKAGFVVTGSDGKRIGRKRLALRR